MNAPTPNTLNKTIECKVQGIPYLISLKKDLNSIVIIVARDIEIPKKRFEVKKTFEEFMKMSKMFVLFESVEEIVDELYSIFKGNNFKLQEEEDKIVIYISFIINERKKEEICLEMPQCEINSNDIIIDLCNSVNQMNNTLSLVNQRLNNLETKLSKKKLSKTIELIDKDFLNTIIKKISKESINFKLIYKATINGDSSQAFHSCCDYKSPTLIVIQTKKLIVFGGYCNIPWDQTNGYKSDSKAFLFSNNLKKIYPIKSGFQDEAIYSSISNGATFGGGSDIYIANNCLSQAGVVNFSSYENGSRYELNNNENEFEVKEVEVYKVKFGE